ncbi:MAG: putative solute:sodium symporter small subunit [Planctomycetota bacterium]|jgi:putative solute:sodium symporter small subunit
MAMSQRATDYWRANLRLLGMIMVVWFSVSYLAGIVFVEELNRFDFLGYPLGFWFAQQGSIYTFVLLIFFYSWRMSKLDHKFGLDE